MNLRSILRTLVMTTMLYGLWIPAMTAHAAGVVGTGTLASCTEAALDTALAAGGSVTFNCGAAPFVMMLTTTKTINVNTTIDGGGKITLDGGGAVQFFFVSVAKSLTLKNMVLSHGKIPASNGGAVDNHGTLTVSDCMFFQNGTSAVGTLGGAISNYTTATITDSAFIGNALGTGGEGGAIYNAGTLVIVGSYFANNQAPNGDGGAIANAGPLQVSNSYFTANGAASGGAIWGNGADMKIDHSTFYKNTATTNGGALWGPRLTLSTSTVDSNSAPSAGGLLAGTPVTISGSLFTNNQATLGDGGGLANISGPNTITNSTFTGNSAVGNGGGIYNGSLLTLNNVTLAGNSSGSGVYTTSFLSLKNTILSANSPGNCAGAGTITSLGHNIDSAATCALSGAGDQSTTNPGLGTLGNHGGPTKSMPLLAGSAAIDKGSNTTCSNRDQRGVARPQGGICDVGAYEVNVITFTSVGVYDGSVLETGKATNLGGTVDSPGAGLTVGDDAANRRFRSILSFGTTLLPDGAQVVQARLDVKPKATVGNPSGTQGALVVDVRKPYFGTGLPLVSADWQAAAGVSAGATLGPFSGLCTGLLNSAARAQVNTLGPTQLRLRFATEAYNGAADNLTFYSGDAGTAAYRPKLVVYYNP